MIFLYILLAVVILLLMVIIHEFGHYVAGKLLKFKINEFSVGFGPKLFSKKKKNGEVFSLRLVPLGGYCAFEGETDTEESAPAPAPADPFAGHAPCGIAEDAGKAFIDEKPWKRLIVLLAGGVFNLLSAVIFSFLFILIVGYATPRVTEVYHVPAQDGAAYSQLTAGDEIVAVNGQKITVMHTFEDYTSRLQLGDEITVTVRRAGREIEIPIKVQNITTDDNNNYTGFGFVSDRLYSNKDVGYSLLYAVPFTGKMAWSILGSFWNLITGQIPITSLTGPVGTIGMMASLTQENWRNILILLPLIASNLGLFNLLPIPALDGSKVIFTVIEWVRGKPINRKVENTIHSVGLMVLLAFVVIIDIVGFFLR